MTETLTLSFKAESFSVDAETRTIKGRAVPYGVTTRAGDYRNIRFAKGSLGYEQPGDVKVFLNHDTLTLPVGVMTTADESDDGMDVSTRIASGDEGDRILSLAAEGILDRFSVGVVPIKWETDEENDFQTITASDWLELSLTAIPAFKEARATEVHATMESETNMEDKNDAVVEASAVEAPEVTPVRANVDVVQRPLYNLTGQGLASEYDFATDLKSAINGDFVSKARIDGFIAETFAAPVTQSDAGHLQNVYRPDLYVDYIAKAAPVYSALHAGATDGTPMVLPKYSSDTGLVGDHTEGTEPTDGDFTTTEQTVTPVAISGRASITREVLMRPSSPDVSALVWQQMNRRYAEALETKAAAILTGATLAELGTAITAGDTDPSPEVEAALAGAVFIDGAAFWSQVLTHRELYSALAGITASDGRKKYPVNNPVNGTGSFASKFRSLDVAGYEFVPAATLGAVGTNQKSFIGDFAYAPAYSSAPLRIEWEEVAKGYIGLFGWFAGAVTDANRLRKITFDATA